MNMRHVLKKSRYIYFLTSNKERANQKKDVVERKTQSSDGKYEKKVITCPESIVMFKKYMHGRS